MIIRNRRTKPHTTYNVDYDFVVDIINKNIENLNTLTDQVKNEIEKMINSNDVYTLTELKKKIKSLFKSSGPNDVAYWITRGWENPYDKVVETQRENSKRCPEFWMKRGYTYEESVKLVSKWQKENFDRLSKKLNGDYSCFNVYSIEKYINKGYSEKQAKQKIEQKKLIDKLAQSPEYLIKVKGWSKEDVDMHNKKKGKSGKLNGMYGITPDIKAGASISGFYKKIPFRSLLEYSYIKLLEKTCVEFVSCDIPKTKSDYLIEIDENQTYTPDFYIPEQNLIIELKNSGSLKRFKEKLQNVSKYYELHNINFKILTEQDVECDIIQMKKDYDNNLIEFASDNKFNKFKNRLKEHEENKISNPY